ncbi:MAG: ParB/RepB/Spo0J family partition protein [Candidatus Woesearchaeota archaeon]
MATKEVSPEELIDNPVSKRIFEDLTDEKFIALKDDIKARKLQHLPEITIGNVIITGHQRIRACRALGMTKIPCIVRDDLDTEEKQTEQAIIDNILRRELTPYEIFKAGEVLEKINPAKRGGDHRSKEYQTGLSDPHEQGRTRDKVAAVLGISGKTYDNIKRAFREEDGKVKSEPQKPEKMPLSLNNIGKLWQLGVTAGSDEKLPDRFLYSDSIGPAGIIPKTIGAHQVIKAHFDAVEIPVPQYDYKVGPDHMDQELAVNVDPQSLRQLLDLAKHYPKITLKAKPGNPLWLESPDFILILAPMNHEAP